MLFNAQVAVKYSAPAISLDLAVNIFLLFCYFIRKGGLYRKINRESFVLTKPMLFLLISYLISTVVGPLNTVKGINSIIKYFVTSFGVLFLALKVLDTKEDVRFYIKSATIVMLLIVCLAISESILKDNLWLDFVYFNSPHDATTVGRMFYDPNNIELRYGMVRARSFFGIHIALGLACVCYFWLYQVIYTRKWRYEKNSVLILLSILTMSGVIMANAKTGYIGLAIVILGLYPLSSFVKPKIIIPIAVAIILLIIYFPEYLNNFISLYDPTVAEEGGGSSVQGRQIQFAVAQQMFEMNPIFGNGPGSIAEMVRENPAFADILGAESSIMQVLPERGIVGFVAYIYLYISIYNKLKIAIPKRLLFFYIFAILTMEFVTGILDMAIWGTVLFAVYRMYSLNRNPKD